MLLQGYQEQYIGDNHRYEADDQRGLSATPAGTQIIGKVGERNVDQTVDDFSNKCQGSPQTGNDQIFVQVGPLFHVLIEAAHQQCAAQVGAHDDAQHIDAQAGAGVQDQLAFFHRCQPLF